VSSDVLQYLAFTPKTGRRSFSQFFAAMFQLIEGFSLSPAEQELRSRLRYVRELFGAGLLASESRDELDRRIDAVLHDEFFHRALAEILRVGLVGDLAKLVEPAPGFAERLWGLYLPALAELDAGDRVDDALADALRRLLALLPPGDLAAQVREARDLHPAGFLQDGSVPPEQSAVFLAFFRSLVCVIALGLLLDRPHAAEPWLTLALAERRLLGSWELLRLFASVPELEVPIDLVPMESRLDLAAIQARPRWVIVRERLMLADPPAAPTTSAPLVGEPIEVDAPAAVARRTGGPMGLVALARRHTSSERGAIRSDDPDFRFAGDDPFESLVKRDG
jgi:hypothetical protein